MVLTEESGQGTAITRERAGGFDVVFSCGGDGTLREVITGAIDHDVIVGTIPAGTANDVAQATGISPKADRAIEQLAQGRIRRIDLMQINGGDAWSAVGIGMGIDARAVERSEYLGKPLLGRASYLAGVIAELDHQLLTHLEVSFGSFGWKGDGMLVQVVNSTNHGRVQVAPSACIDDGFLHVLLVEGMPRARALKLLPRLLRGEHTEAPEIRHWIGREVTIGQSPGGPAIIDGEVEEHKALSIRVLPRRLKFWVPTDR